jgi:hypothetical protein
MKTPLCLIALAVAMLVSPAFAQENQHCYKPVPDSHTYSVDVCEFPSGRVNVTESIGEDTHSEWYSPEEWKTAKPVLRKSWDARNQALTEKLSTPKEKCEAAGGNWSNTRFRKCQLPKAAK